MAPAAMLTTTSSLLASLALLPSVLVAPVEEPEGETDSAAAETEALKQRLQALEDELEEDLAKSYLVVRGYIAGSENVFMETMDVDSAKAWCNSHADCKGFTFGGDMERPEDEVAAAREATAQARATVLSLASGDGDLQVGLQG